MENWCQAEFEDVDFGDKRLNRRFIKVADQLMCSPLRSICEACGQWADIKAAYRFFENGKVSATHMLEAHRHRTQARMKGQEIVLAIQDSSMLNYAKYSSIVNMGTIEGRNRHTYKGVVVHATLAVTPAGDCLGLLDHQIFSRKPHERRKSHYEHLHVPITEKESYRWITSFRASATGRNCETTVVTVGDREADIYELFQEAQEQGGFFLVRAAKDRQLAEPSSEGRKIGEILAAKEAAGRCFLEIKASNNRKERIAEVEIKFREIVLKPPVRKIKARIEVLKPVTVWAVCAFEPSPPKGVDRVCWILLTNHPVDNLREAYEKIQWYQKRWTIETYFKTLKSGFRIEETRLNHIAKMERFIVLISILATRVMNLANHRSDVANRNLDQMFSKREQEIIVARRSLRGEYDPSKPLSVADAILEVAMMGGYLGRSNDPPPGVTTIWRGLQKIHDIEQEWQLLKKLVGKT